MKNINGKFYEIVLQRPNETLSEAKEKFGKRLDKSTDYTTYIGSRIKFFKFLDIKEEKKEEEFKSDRILLVKEVGTDNYLGMFLYTTSFESEALFEVTVDESNPDYMEHRYIVTLMAEHLFTEMGYEECKQWVYDKDIYISKFITCELGYYFMDGGAMIGNDLPSSVYYKSLNKHTKRTFEFYHRDRWKPQTVSPEISLNEKGGK
jgi:hypothetical protein